RPETDSRHSEPRGKSVPIPVPRAAVKMTRVLTRVYEGLTGSLNRLRISCASADPNLLVEHPKRKADKHETQHTGPHVLECAPRRERPTQRARPPRSPHIHSHHAHRQLYTQ